MIDSFAFYDNPKLVKRLVRFRQLPFIQVLQRTMLTLFPVALIGAFAWLIARVFLSPAGFLGNILAIKSWFPQYRFFYYVVNDVYNVTIGFIAPYAALASAQLTLRQHQKDIPIAGIFAMASYVLIFLHDVRGRDGIIDMRYYSAHWFIIGVLVGYGIGLIFAKFGQQSRVDNFELKSRDIMSRAFDNLKPLLIVLVLTFLIHVIYAVIRTFEVDTMVSQGLAELLNRNSNYGTTIIMSIVITLSAWLGFPELLNVPSSMFSGELYANLNYALTHKSNWEIPYPFTPSALYNGFANFGGVGVTLAFVIAILWVSRQRNLQRVAVASAVPVFFNVNYPLLYGAVMILNPIYLLPTLLLPVFNMVVASALILLHVIPPLAYPIPVNTPGILGPLMGSGGNWLTFVVSIILLLIDIAVYIPFVKLADRVDQQLADKRKGGDDRETK
ncbi:PTS transporter subunit EIIC [Limosilactobacillus difficilis]|uniref:PTS transporter subunit EIIC n=1 Tax=Limosilactobacillus difficilis TaxID=2991838 RepID=UPI0024BAC678|nr:PTS transporter subunit EIIC [Limosilactobacillus difficilis]